MPIINGSDWGMTAEQGISGFKRRDRRCNRARVRGRQVMGRRLFRTSTDTMKARAAVLELLHPISRIRLHDLFIHLLSSGKVRVAIHMRRDTPACKAFADFRFKRPHDIDKAQA